MLLELSVVSKSTVITMASVTAGPQLRCATSFAGLRVSDVHVFERTVERVRSLLVTPLTIDN